MVNLPKQRVRRQVGTRTRQGSFFGSLHNASCTYGHQEYFFLGHVCRLLQERNGHVSRVKRAKRVPRHVTNAFYPSFRLWIFVFYDVYAPRSSVSYRDLRNGRVHVVEGTRVRVLYLRGVIGFFRMVFSVCGGRRIAKQVRTFRVAMTTVVGTIRRYKAMVGVDVTGVLASQYSFVGGVVNFFYRGRDLYLVLPSAILSVPIGCVLMVFGLRGLYL